VIKKKVAKPLMFLAMIITLVPMTDVALVPVAGILLSPVMITISVLKILVINIMGANILQSPALIETPANVLIVYPPMVVYIMILFAVIRMIVLLTAVTPMPKKVITLVSLLLLSATINPNVLKISANLTMVVVNLLIFLVLEKTNVMTLSVTLIRDVFK
jgi:hypothetical protein